MASLSGRVRKGSACSLAGEERPAIGGSPPGQGLPSDKETATNRISHAKQQHMLRELSLCYTQNAVLPLAIIYAFIEDGAVYTLNDLGYIEEAEQESTVFDTSAGACWYANSSRGFQVPCQREGFRRNPGDFTLQHSSKHNLPHYQKLKKQVQLAIQGNPRFSATAPMSQVCLPAKGSEPKSSKMSRKNKSTANSSPSDGASTDSPRPIRITTLRRRVYNPRSTLVIYAADFENLHAKEPATKYIWSEDGTHLCIGDKYQLNEPLAPKDMQSFYDNIPVEYAHLATQVEIQLFQSMHSSHLTQYQREKYGIEPTDLSQMPESTSDAVPYPDYDTEFPALKLDISKHTTSQASEPSQYQPDRNPQNKRKNSDETDYSRKQIAISDDEHSSSDMEEEQSSLQRSVSPIKSQPTQSEPQQASTSQQKEPYQASEATEHMVDNTICAETNSHPNTRTKRKNTSEEDNTRKQQAYSDVEDGRNNEEDNSSASDQPPSLSGSTPRDPNNFHSHMEVQSEEQPSIIVTGKVTRYIFKSEQLTQPPVGGDDFALILQPQDKNTKFSDLSQCILADAVNAACKGLGVVTRHKHLAKGGLLLAVNNEETRQCLMKLVSIASVPITTNYPGSDAKCKGFLSNVSEAESAQDLKIIFEKQTSNRVLEITRFQNRKGSKTNLVVTFQGTKLPERLHIGWSSHPVSKYIAQQTQCYRCQSYMHLAAQCKNEQKCLYCSQAHRHSECPVKQQGLPPTCSNCGERHVSIYANCPVRKEVNAIKKCQVTENLPYKEAKNQVSIRGGTYANALARNRPAPFTRHVQEKTFATQQMAKSAASAKQQSQVPPISEPSQSDARSKEQTKQVAQATCDKCHNQKTAQMPCATNPVLVTDPNAQQVMQLLNLIKMFVMNMPQSAFADIILNCIEQIMSSTVGAQHP